MKYTYKTKGTCASMIEIDINDESKIIDDARFVGGCAGNATGVTRLVIGMPAADAVEKLKGIKCGSKKTSCPDQFSVALSEALEQMSNKNAGLNLKEGVI